MASSQPTSSPTRSASPDRFDLSPHAILRKLLAVVESDSDGEEKTRSSLKQPRFTRLSSPASDRDSKTQAPSISPTMQGEAKESENDARERVRKLLEQSATRDQKQNTNTAYNSEDEDEIVARPRGRLASRMQGATDAVKNAGSNLQPREPGDVEMADTGKDDDEDEDVPVRRRKPATRQSRSITPEPSAQRPQKEASPGLFVTPSKSPLSARNSPVAGSGDESDLPTISSDRFRALVEKKRKERLAREAEEAQKREARRTAALEELDDDKDDDVSDISDDEGGRKLTQTQKQSRPSRKAGKKALEEMNRETQRMQRAMQLAHEAKTKKKITKAALFERFNYNPAGKAATKEKQQSSSRSQTPSSMKSTDAEMQDAETPPSSPPAQVQDVLGKDIAGSASRSGAAASANGAAATNKEEVAENNDEDLPDILDIQAFARKPVNKDKETTTTLVKAATKRHVRVKLPPLQANRISLSSDEEDGLIVVDKKKSKLDALFDRVPKTKSRESSSLRMLRQLAHLDSPERKAYKKTDKSAMTPGELQAFLAQQAREQAKLERERRLESLKAKGIHVQTEEERERDREHIEDMVARARREAEEIMDRERDEARMEKKARGEDPLGWDDSGSDNDYVEDKNVEEDAEADVEFSGSEEEDNDSNDDGEQEAEQTPKKTHAAQAMIDSAAAATDDDDASETEQSWVDPDEEEERHRWGEEDESMDATPAFVQAMRPKGSLAFVSDDEDPEVEATPKPSKTYATTFTPKPAATQMMNFNNNTSPEVPTSVLRSAAKTFIPGLPVDAGGPAGLGLTQIFAGTMDDSQEGPLGGSPSQPMPTFHNFTDSQLSQNAFGSADDMVLDSQPVPATQADGEDESQVLLNLSQSQTHGLDSLLRDDLATQSSEMFDPSQDNGFQKWTPLKKRFVEPPVSTVDTVIRDSSDVEDMSHESPLLQKRSRFRRKAIIASDSEDEAFDSGSKPSAFRILKDAAAQEEKRKAREEFNKKKSKARGMVEEQAEESEDEYAGLGGVDGEDSDDNDDAASVHEMIDDQTQGNEEDEAKIAALHAERQRAEDAKQTDKLFHDITRGMLRRKRGADYDLSDSDDGGEARRRMKRRQFAKMQKMLLSDERVSKVAENPRNQAFLRTIEDVGSDEEMDFLFEPAPRNNEDSSLSISSGNAAQENDAHNKTVPDSQPSAGIESANKAPVAPRRAKHGRKPANLGEIRETLSNLLDEPSGNTVISATDFGSDGESGSEDGNDSESSNKENANPRRRRGGAVVDRISLKRQGSSNSSTVGRMAFAAPSSSANGGFKVPALLRKATTNSLMSSGSSNGTSGNGGGSGGSAGGFGEEAKVKKNAGKRSGISYLARETDRRAKLDEAEKRREAKKFKAVEGRGRVVGGLFGAGKFE